MRILNRRIITFVCFFVMIGIFIGYAFKMDFSQAMWPYLLIGGAAALFVFFTKKFLVAVCLAALCLGNFLFIQSFVTDFNSIKPHTEYTITGTVCDYPLNKSPNTRYNLSGVTLNDGNETIRFPKNVQLTAPNDKFVYGDVITFQSAVFPPDGETMPGSYNEQIYLAGQGDGFSVYCDEVKKTGHIWTLYTPFLQARAALEANIDAMYSPDAAPVAKAMFLGLQNEISQDVYTSFSKTGITHILSISGLHISLIAVILNFLLSRVKFNRNARYILNIALLLLYTSITGFPVSVVRAALMTILYLIARWRFMERDTLVFLSAAMLATLLFSPVQLFMPGFLLSYGTVFGILCVYPPLKRLIRNKKTLQTGEMGEMVCVSASATAASLPMTAYYFSNIAWIAPVANFYAIPVSSAILVFTGLSALLSVVWMQIGRFFAMISESLIKFLIIVNKFVSGSELGYTKVYHFPVWAGIAAFAALFVVSDYFMVKWRFKAIILASLLSVSLVVGVFAVPPQSPLTINFLDVENGEAIHIAYNQKNILISNATTSAAYAMESAL
ncbi:MAG: ComEC/Rec2 family competence protein [Eubacteriales bacterium]